MWPSSTTEKMQRNWIPLSVMQGGFHNAVNQYKREQKERKKKKKNNCQVVLKVVTVSESRQILHPE